MRDDNREYFKLGIAPPSVEQHTYGEDPRANLRKLMPSSWHLEGNKLIGMTEMGPLVQFIPTDHILTGTDSAGLPIFKKIEV